MGHFESDCPFGTLLAIWSQMITQIFPTTHSLSMIHKARWRDLINPVQCSKSLLLKFSVNKDYPGCVLKTQVSVFRNCDSLYLFWVISSHSHLQSNALSAELYPPPVTFENHCCRAISLVKNLSPQRQFLCILHLFLQVLKIFLISHLFGIFD